MCFWCCIQWVALRFWKKQWCHWIDMESERFIGTKGCPFFFTWVCATFSFSLFFLEFELDQRDSTNGSMNYDFGPLIQDQFQASPLSVLRCHEAWKAWRTCTKCDYMMWKWGIVSKCSPPPLKFNWIGLLPIQLNLFPTTHIKHPLSACEITKLPLIQKLV